MGFKAIEDGSAVIQLNGVYQEVPLASRDGALYAEISRGKFVRLKADGSASKVKMRLDTLEYDGPLYSDRFGRLTVEDGDGFKQLVAHPDGRIEPPQIEDKSKE